MLLSLGCQTSELRFMTLALGLHHLVAQGATLLAFQPVPLGMLTSMPIQAVRKDEVVGEIIDVRKGMRAGNSGGRMPSSSIVIVKPQRNQQPIHRWGLHQNGDDVSKA